MHSPGPAHDGSKPASSIGMAPAQPFGTGKRPGLDRRVSCTCRKYCMIAHQLTSVRVNVQNDYEAGPGSHEINRGMGDNMHVLRNPPKYRCAKPGHACSLLTDVCRTPVEHSTSTE